MNRTAFWKLIDDTRPDGGDCEQHVKNLLERLGKQKSEAIVDFEKHRMDLGDELYDVGVVEVLWILTGGGPGDEGWATFRNWIILQGRKAFETIVKHPDRLPELYPPGTDIYCIGLESVARKAYQSVTGKRDFDDHYENVHGVYRLPDAPRGAKQDPRVEDEKVLEKRLRKKWPDVWKHEAAFD